MAALDTRRHPLPIAVRKELRGRLRGHRAPVLGRVNPGDQASSAGSSRPSPLQKHPAAGGGQGGWRRGSQTFDPPGVGGGSTPAWKWQGPWILRMQHYVIIRARPQPPPTHLHASILTFFPLPFDLVPTISASWMKIVFPLERLAEFFPFPEVRTSALRPVYWALSPL